MVSNLVPFAIAAASLFYSCSAELTSSVSPAPYWYKPLVTSLALQWRIQTENLFGHAKALEVIAYNTAGRNRLMGTPGHEGTVKYIVDQLNDPLLGGYYNITLQDWTGKIQERGNASFFANDINATISLADFSPSTNGTLVAPLVVVNNLGCNTTDFPPIVAGNIALISRGSCTFASKSAGAGAAGAVGAVIYNNIGGGIPGMTLGTDSLSTVPTVGLSLEAGLALRNNITAGTPVTGRLFVFTIIKNVTTQNILAQSKGGDPDNVLVLGAHTDSVAAGPGINDDGSGVSGILEVAKQLSTFRTRNAVRFGFWSGEEEGLLGSTFYVNSLNAEEKQKIKLYLNFDMIASPNYIYGIFDGDGGDFNVTGPPGSANIEELFENYFEARDLPYAAIEFTGRSDYDPFTKASIPAGGLETGAERNKTQAEADEFGGQVGVPYDVNYHQAGDTLANLNGTAFLVNSQAIAHAVATYARSFRSVDFTNGTEAEEDGRRRGVVRRAERKKIVRRSRGGEKQQWVARRYKNVHFK